MVAVEASPALLAPTKLRRMPRKLLVVLLVAVVAFSLGRASASPALIRWQTAAGQASSWPALPLVCFLAVGALLAAAAPAAVVFWTTLIVLMALAGRPRRQINAVGWQSAVIIPFLVVAGWMCGGVQSTMPVAARRRARRSSGGGGGDRRSASN